MFLFKSWHCSFLTDISQSVQNNNVLSLSVNRNYDRNVLPNTQYLFINSCHQTLELQFIIKDTSPITLPSKLSLTQDILLFYILQS